MISPRHASTCGGAEQGLKNSWLPSSSSCVMSGWPHVCSSTSHSQAFGRAAIQIDKGDPCCWASAGKLLYFGLLWHLFWKQFNLRGRFLCLQNILGLSLGNLSIMWTSFQLFHYSVVWGNEQVLGDGTHEHLGPVSLPDFLKPYF